METDMNTPKTRLEDCDVGDWVKCSDATENEFAGNELLLPSSAHPHRDLNTWKFERRLLSRVTVLPHSPGSGWMDEAPLKVETFFIWTRVN